MRVLWVINRILPLFYENLGIKQENYGGGWLTGLSDSLRSSEGIQLCICAPLSNIGHIQKGQVENVKYYFFPEKNVRDYLPESVQYLRNIAEEFQPDVIHVFGTEYPRTLEVLEAAGSERVLISLTGVLGEYAPRYFAGLPRNAIKQHRFLRWIAQKNRRLFFLQNRLIRYGYEDFCAREVFEKKALQKARYVTGRTQFDEKFVKSINPDISYHFCNESLRDTFYAGDRWKVDACQPHSVFISNAGYPIKGFHQMIEAAKELIDQFPDLQIYVAGNSPFAKGNGIKNALLQLTDEYAQYLKRQISHHDLKNRITFLGNLNAEQMKAAYLRANVFVLPSVIENSPNSLGEAMLLGVPCVASNVGGVAQMMRHESEGIIYSFGNISGLAAGIARIFSDTQLAEQYGAAAAEHAQKTHCVQENNDTMVAIYRLIKQNATEGVE